MVGALTESARRKTLRRPTTPLHPPPATVFSCRTMALTPGAVSRLIQNDDNGRVIVNGQAIVQVIDHKPLGGGAQSQQTRHRLVISDGQVFMTAMLVTQLNHHVDNGSVRPPRAPRSPFRTPPPAPRNEAGLTRRNVIAATAPQRGRT